MLPLSKKTKQKLEEYENKLEDSGWINLTLKNSWTTHSGQNVPAYRRKNGVVYLRGLVYAGTDTSERILAILPTDCIPGGINNNLYFTVAQNRNVCRNVQIQKDGGILAPGDLAQGQWFPLEGISFPV